MSIRGIKGVKVISRDAKHTGETTGGHYHCTLECCKGDRIAVRWDNGRITFPCTKGMTLVNRGKVWKII